MGWESYSAPEEGIPTQCSLQIHQRIKRERHILWRPTEKEIPLENRITAQWIKGALSPRVFTVSTQQDFSTAIAQCLLSVSMPHSLTPHSMSLFSHCYLLESRERGENQSLKFLSLQTRGAASGPDEDFTVMKFTLSRLWWYRERAKFSFKF